MSADLSAAIMASIKCRRQAANLTQSELADKAGVSRKHFSELERGKLPGYPSLGLLGCVAGVLGCTVAELLREPSCGTCLDVPRAGFTCNECGAGGEPRA